jgi:hypothetical protein
MVITKEKNKTLTEKTDFIIMSITSLRTENLHEVLNTNYYYDELPFGLFITELRERFEVLALLGNTHLIATNANCKECNCSYLIHHFKGNATEDQFSLYIESNNQLITDVRYDLLQKSQITYDESGEPNPF